MEKTKNKKIIIVGVVVVSLLIILGIVVMPILIPDNTAKQNGVRVVQTTCAIKGGDQITDDNVQNILVKGKLPDNIVTDKTKIIGKYAKTDLKNSSYVLADAVSDQKPVQLQQTKSNTQFQNSSDVMKSLDGSKEIVSVSIKSYAASLSGQLQAGDIISLVVDNSGKVTNIPELQYVKVVSASTDAKDGSAAVLTLLVTPEQKKKLLTYDDKLHVSLEYRGTADNAQKFLDEEDQYLQKASISSALTSSSKVDKKSTD